MGQIDSLAFLSSGKGNCKEVECPQYLQVKRGKSTSTSVKKIYISTVFYHYFLHSTMIFSHFSPSRMTFTFYISTTFFSSFLNSTIYTEIWHILQKNNQWPWDTFNPFQWTRTPQITPCQYSRACKSHLQWGKLIPWPFSLLEREIVRRLSALNIYK